MPQTPPAQKLQPVSFRIRFAPFRLLAIVYGLAAIAGGWEYLHRRQPVDLYLDRQRNYADTLFQLYPERSEATYEKAVQSLLCLRAQSQFQMTPPACRQYAGQDLRHEFKRGIEKSLATGVKTKEELYYSYLQILIGTQAPQAEIDAAYAAWRGNFPLSSLPDPRLRQGK